MKTLIILALATSALALGACRSDGPGNGYSGHYDKTNTTTGYRKGWKHEAMEPKGEDSGEE